MYKVKLLPDAEESFKNLDKTIQCRIAGKIDWLAENADTMIHHHLSSLPEDLRGLCRIRMGDYRILYWT
jgi:mRNA-degrading endonuclease RelE of RelBE toxin-antitoxin system